MIRDEDFVSEEDKKRLIEDLVDLEPEDRGRILNHYPEAYFTIKSYLYNNARMVRLRGPGDTASSGRVKPEVMGALLSSLDCLGLTSQQQRGDRPPMWTITDSEEALEFLYDAIEKYHELEDENGRWEKVLDEMDVIDLNS